MIFPSWEGVNGRRGGREQKDAFWQGFCPRLVMRGYGGMREHEGQKGCEVVMTCLYQGVWENKTGKQGVSHDCPVRGEQLVPFCDGWKLLGVLAVLLGGRESGEREWVVSGRPQQSFYRGHPGLSCWG